MDDKIRKISVGADVRSAIHYQVGSVSHGKKISDIVLDGNLVNIYVSDGEVKMKWKAFSMASVIHMEFDTDV